MFLNLPSCVRRRSTNLERGTSPVSFIMVLVIVLLIAELAVVGGRLAGAQAAVSNAARAAARQATLVQTQGQVAGVVSSTAVENLENGNIECSSVNAVPVGNTFGQGRWIEVRVTCTVPLSDLSGFGIPLPDMDIDATHRELVETYRAVGVVTP